MDKRLKITEIAARTQLSISTVSRVLAGKANTSEKARAKVLACARELGVMDGMAAGRLLLNSLVVFAPQRAFDERSDIFYYRVIQSVSKGLASHDVRLRYCALEENDSDAQLFLARMNEPDTQVASVWAAVVLAKPGTDSIRICPPATKVTISDSRRLS